jgi:hypothetical protein
MRLLSDDSVKLRYYKSAFRATARQLSSEKLPMFSKCIMAILSLS